MNDLRKAAEQSLAPVREAIRIELRKVIDAELEVQPLMDASLSLFATIDTLLDVIDAYEAEHENGGENFPDGLGSYIDLHIETEAAKATALARMKG